MATDSADPPPPAPARPEDRIEALKRAAAKAAAAQVRDGMKVGLGTGSTVAHLLPALAARGLRGVRCVATSPATAQAAGALGLTICTLDDLGGQLDIAIDGADQVAGDGWLIKGGGGAHTREKIVCAAARRFVAIVSEEKLVQRLRPPVPLELMRFGLSATLAAVAPAQLRGIPDSPDGGAIADHLGEIDDPLALAKRLSATPGVVEHGLFAPELVSEVVVAAAGGVRRIAGAKRD